jgi:hypothetical protein
MTRYWAERLRPQVTMPLAASIAFAATAGSRFDIARWAVDAALAMFFIAQFRLWDDLADRAADRVAHPDRVLVRTAHEPFVAMCAGLAIANIAGTGLLRGVWSAVTLLAVNILAWTYYARRTEARTAARDLALLAKYPTFVCVLAAGGSSSLLYVLPAAGAIYVLVVAFEIRDDASGPLRWNNS